jgi:hypothetical protein
MVCQKLRLVAGIVMFLGFAACGGSSSISVAGKVALIGVSDASGLEVDVLLGADQVGSTRTKADGSYSMGGLSKATYTVDIKAPFTTEKEVSFPQLADASPVSTTTTLHPFGLANVTVVNPFACPGTMYQRFTLQVGGASPDGHEYPPGDQTVTAQLTQGSPEISLGVVHIVYGQTTQATFTAPGGSLTLTGNVSLPGLTVNLGGDQGGVQGCGTNVVADANGNFSFPGLPDDGEPFLVTWGANPNLDPNCSPLATGAPIHCTVGQPCNLPLPTAFGYVAGAVTKNGLPVDPSTASLRNSADGGPGSVMVDVRWNQTTHDNIELAP